jgi:transposase
LSPKGEILLHRNLTAAPEPFLTAVPPSRAGLVVAVECMCTWYGLAALCAAQDIPFVLGHARSMKARHGGKANNDTIDSQKIAALLRGDMLPTAYVSPAERRATRALLRRRTPLMRKRAALLAHGHNTTAQYHLPDIGKKLAYNAHRQGGAERFNDPAGHKTSAVALAFIPYDDALLRDLERAIVQTARQPDAQTRSLLHTVPGIGNILRLVLRYEIHDIGRFPSVQDVASYARLGTCSQESAGKRVGTAGKKIGHAHLQWAFSAAATVFLRHNPHGQKLLTRLEKTHGTGKALPILAHTLARAVYYLLTRNTAFDMERFVRTYRSRAGAPRVALDTHGMRLHPARGIAYLAASWNVQACRGPVSQSPCG